MPVDRDFDADPSQSFAAQSETHRFHMRRVIERLGGCIWTYSEGGIIIFLPSDTDKRFALKRVLESENYHYTGAPAWLSPPSDTLPDSVLFGRRGEQQVLCTSLSYLEVLAE